MGPLIASLDTWRSGALVVLGLTAALVVLVVLVEHALAWRRPHLRRLRSVHELGYRWAWIGALAAFPLGLGILVVVVLSIARGGPVLGWSVAAAVGLAVLFGAFRVSRRVGPAAAPELVKSVVLERIKPLGAGVEFPFGLGVLATPPSIRFRKQRAAAWLVLSAVLVFGLALILAASGVLPIKPLLESLGRVLAWLPPEVAALIAGIALSVAVVLDLANWRFVLLSFGTHVALVYVLLPAVALAAAAGAGVPWGLFWGTGLGWVAFTAVGRGLWLRGQRGAVARYKIERSISSILDEEEEAVRAAWQIFDAPGAGTETGFELESALSTLAGREWLSAGAGEIGSAAYRVAGVQVDTFELRVRTVRREISSPADAGLDPWRLPLKSPRGWHGGTTRTVRELEDPVRATVTTEWSDYGGWQAAPPVRDVPALRRGQSAVAEAAIVKDMKVGSAVHPEPDDATNAFIRLASRIHVHRREIATFFSHPEGTRLSDVELRALRFPLYSLIPEGSQHPTVWITGWRGVVASHLPISWPALVVAGLMPTLLVALAVYAITAVASLVLP